MSAPLRVALLSGAGNANAVALAAALRAVGHEATLLTSAPAPADVPSIRLCEVPDRPLHFRFIGDGLAHVPHAWLALARGRFDVAQAFSPVDALPALRSALPLVLTFTKPLRRETIGNRRLRLATLERAIGRADTVVAADEEVQRSLRRLLAIDAPVVDASDAAGHVALYRDLTLRAP